jgi:hypothetical protein
VSGPGVLPHDVDSVERLLRELALLEHTARTQALDAPARTRLRIQTMILVDRLELEQGKRRLLEGHYAAARYHLEAARQRPWYMRFVVFGLRFAPRLMRAAYRKFRPSAWTPASVSSH